MDWRRLAIGFFEDAIALTGDLVQADQKFGGAITELIEETEFKGSVGSTVVTRVPAGSSVRKLILVGLGKADALTLDGLRRGAAAIARTAKSERSKTLGISLPVFNDHPAESVQAITEGILLALHQDLRFKSEPDTKGAKLETVDLLAFAAQEAAITQARQFVMV